MSFIVNLAGFNILINSLYDKVYFLCRKYIVTDCKPDFIVTINQEDIDYLRIINDGSSNEDISDAFYETMAVYIKIVKCLIEKKVLVLHGAAIEVNGKGVIFSANSGVGKTTHVKRWLKTFDDVKIINGDKPLLKMENNNVFACGSPWCGKERFNSNKIVPVKAICFLERSETTSIQKISFSEAFQYLVKQIFHPQERDLLMQTYNLLNYLQNIDFYLLKVNNFELESAKIVRKEIFND